MASRYAYTYDERGFIVGETATESLAGYAWDEKHDGKHEDGRHDALYPHGNRHAKHGKDSTCAYQIVETVRTFTYDGAGKLLSATETEENQGTCTYAYGYDAMGNRTSAVKTDENGKVVESSYYVYNESSQLVSVELYNGKKTTTVTYSYDADGNLISETGRDGTEKVEKNYLYAVENRLLAVYDGKELLMAAAYDGDGNRVFQLNYNLHTDGDLKGNSGNGNGSNKDNSGSTPAESVTDTAKNNGNAGNSSANNGKGGNGKDNGSKGNGNSGNGNGNNGNRNGNSGNNGNGNATNAETNSSQNRCGILFPTDSEISEKEAYLISLIKTSGKEKNYELIEYISDVNRTHAEVLVEQNCNGAMDTAYVYGTDRLSLDRFDGSTGYYLYDPKGSATGITNGEGQICLSYRYGAFGEITYGAPQYENIYAYNGESYNPNVGSLYLRARYYNVAAGAFFTEDSYLGNLREPLTLNRYVYCVGNPVNYVDPSGHFVPALAGAIIGGISGLVMGTVTEVGRLIDQGSDYDWQAGLLNVGNSGMAGFVGGGVLGGTGNPVLAGMAGGASYGLLDGVAHTDPQGSFADNSLMVLQSTAIGGAAGSVGGLAGGGMAGALSGTGLSMATQALLTGATAGVYGGSTARLLSGSGITPVTVTQDALLGGAGGLVTYGVASAYQQATAPKPSTTSLQERANLAAQLSEAEGCAGTSGHTQLSILSNKTLTNVTGKVDNYVSNVTGNAAAQADFAAMNPTNIRTYPNGTMAGELPDGRTINIHRSTTLNGVPSLEIYNPITGSSIKIRY